MVEKRRILAILLLLIGLSACAPSDNARVQQVILPTLVAMPTTSINMDDPQRVAMGFLGAWQSQDFPLMYSLLSFGSREAIAYDDFLSAYQDAQDEVTYASLSFAPRGLGRMNERTVQLAYDVTFQTNILGEFSDTNRTLTLILDDNARDWRVAWSMADIFPEMGSGARLEFQAQVPSRANIYDRNGAVLADMEGRMVAIFVVQEDVDQWETCVATLAEVLNFSTERINTIFANSQSFWTTRVGLIEPAAFRNNQARLEADCSATFDGFATRRYPLPYGSQMPHIVGYVGLPNPDQVAELTRQGFNAETIIGQGGVEQTWDVTLRGKPGGSLSLIAPDGTRLRVLAQTTAQIPESIWLTIDGPLQQYVQQSIGEAYGENITTPGGNPGWGSISRGASAVVMNVNTGEILAMVSYPYYDANAYTPYPAIGRETANQIQQEVADDPRIPQLNRPTQGVYPSGSVFKVIDSVALLDSGVFTAEERYTCTGTWLYENDRRYDWNSGHGVVGVRSAIMQSCNPFFYNAGFILNLRDPNLLPSYARRMGLGAPTGLIDIAEDPGLIPDPDYIRQTYGWDWNYSNAVNLAIGQGEIQITPLQLARTYAGIANGGILYRPHLVLQRGILDQRTFIAEPEAMSDFGVPAEVLDVVQAGMCDVVSASLGTANFVFDPYWTTPSPMMELGVCGKTGTAQNNEPNPHSWFAAYAPADNPEIVVVVMVENAGDGSAIAAPITRRIMEYYFFLREQAD